MDNQNQPAVPAAEPKPDDFVTGLKAMAAEDFNVQLNSDPSILEKIEALDSKTIDEIIEAQTKNSQDRASGRAPLPKPAEGAAPAQPASDDDEVTVKLKRSELGSYATGRSPEDAVREMAKGYRIKDKLIDHFKHERIPSLAKLAEESTARIKALEEENAKLKEAVKPPEPTPREEEVVIPPLPENLDFFNEEHQKAIVAHNQALAKRIAQLSKPAEPTPAPAAAPAAAPAPTPAPQATGGQDAAVQEEFNEIRTLQINPQFSQYISTNADIEVLNAQYSQFIENLSRLCGINDVYTVTGDLTKATADVVKAYFNQNDVNGQRIKEAADKASIKPPEETDMLRRIYLIRECSFDRKTGARYPLDAAAHIAKSKYPQDFADKPSKTLENRVRLENALDQRKAHATEIPTQQGGTPLDDEAVIRESLKLVEEKGFAEMTDGEIEIFKTGLAKQGMPQEEINKYYETVIKPHRKQKP